MHGPKTATTVPKSRQHSAIVDFVQLCINNTQNEAFVSAFFPWSTGVARLVSRCIWISDENAGLFQNVGKETSP